MYNHLLDTFFAVVESGSFNSAAEKLYISTTAIRKQINQLEERLDVNLFDRSVKGVELTAYGKYFYQESQKLVRLSEELIERTKNLGKTAPNIIRFGFTPLNSIEDFTRIWHQSPRVNDFKLTLVSYSSDINKEVSTDVHDADSADLGFAMEAAVEGFVETSFLPFVSYRMTVAVPTDHPLAVKKILSLDDLNGQEIYFPNRNAPHLSEEMIRDMQENCPGVRIIGIPLFYDMELFNRFAKEKKLIIACDGWTNIHPGLVNKPVEWKYTVPLGIIWKTNARPEVLDFIEAFKEGLEADRKEREG